MKPARLSSRVFREDQQIMVGIEYKPTGAPGGLADRLSDSTGLSQKIPAQIAKNLITTVPPIAVEEITAYGRAHGHDDA
jgi:hypothetical protein